MLVATRGYGVGSSIAAVAVRGYLVSAPVTPIPDPPPPPVVLPGETPTPVTIADYEFFVRDIRSGVIMQELNPAEVVAGWSRHDVGGGSFTITLPRTADYADHHLHPIPSVIDIWRNGVREFAGVILRHSTTPLAKQLILSGPDLTSFFLSSRIVGVNVSEDYNGIAEDVVKQYVSNALGPDAEVARQATTYLNGRLFIVESSSGRGGNVVTTAQRKSLLAHTQEICRAHHLLQEVILTDYGYEYRITEGVDRTEEAGGIAFTVDWDNVEDFEFDENYEEYRNVYFIAGEGEGDARLVSEYVGDDVETHMRREAVVSERTAETVEQRLHLGAHEFRARNRLAVSVRAKPYRTALGVQYRTDWDVGDIVTFSDDELGHQTDVPIVAVTIQLTAAKGEDITFELGQPSADSTLRRIGQALSKVLAAENI